MQEIRSEKTMEDFLKAVECERVKGKVVESDEAIKKLNILTPNVNDEQILEAAHNPKNEKVSLHRAGSIITMLDGITKYEVQENGEWRKLIL